MESRTCTKCGIGTEVYVHYQRNNHPQAVDFTLCSDCCVAYINWSLSVGDTAPFNITDWIAETK